MKKTISSVLAALLVLTGGMAAFAADGVTAPADVQGTKYETAVTELMEKIGLAGYDDGTFRPENTINRAEMCTILVKGMEPTDTALAAAPSIFGDMDDDNVSWALGYVNYGASKNLVAGDGNGTFRPQDNVTYNEVATMLVNALGYKDSDLTGDWPENYVSKAAELGIYEDVDVEDRGDEAATRGDVALMTAVVVDKIEKAPADEDAADGDSTDTDADKNAEADKEAAEPEVELPEGKAESDNGASIFKTAGGAYGVINGVASVTNSEGSKVTQIEFFMNGTTYYLNGNKSNMMSEEVYDGSLYYIKFNTNKEVKDIYQDPSQSKAKYYKVLAGEDGWVDVVSRDKRVMTVSENDEEKEITISNDAVFYKASFNGSEIDEYEKGSLTGVGKGAKVRAYRVTDDDDQVADVVIYVNSSDARRM